MSAEIIKEVKERAAKFLNWIEFSMNDPNALKAAINFFEYNESALKAIVQSAKIDLAASSSIDLQNNSLNRLLQSYNVNRPFDYKEADNKFKKGLILIITEGYSYNGIYFEKGKEKLWS